MGAGGRFPIHLVYREMQRGVTQLSQAYRSGDAAFSTQHSLPPECLPQQQLQGQTDSKDRCNMWRVLLSSAILQQIRNSNAQKEQGWFWMLWVGGKRSTTKNFLMFFCCFEFYWNVVHAWLAWGCHRRRDSVSRECKPSAQLCSAFYSCMRWKANSASS